MPLRMPEIKINSWPPISTTLLMNNSWVRMRKMEKASNTILWRACFPRHLKRPIIEMAEKKSPTIVAIQFGFFTGTARAEIPCPSLSQDTPGPLLFQ
jgi:hypothetical protein